MDDKWMGVVLMGIQMRLCNAIINFVINVMRDILSGYDSVRFQIQCFSQVSCSEAPLEPPHLIFQGVKLWPTWPPHPVPVWSITLKQVSVPHPVKFPGVTILRLQIPLNILLMTSNCAPEISFSRRPSYFSCNSSLLNNMTK